MATTLKHKNSDPLPNTEHAGYWPYSREQYSHASIIFERFKSWKYRLEVWLFYKYINFNNYCVILFYIYLYLKNFK